jgi:CheY-like chemotaxis protein
LILILTSRNENISARLESSYFQRLGVIHHAEEMGEALLRRAIQLQPQVVIINWELPDPDLDGFELCGMMRTRPELHQVRVLVAVRREHLSARVLRHAERAGAHNVVAYPCSAEELFQHLSQVLGLPRRLGRRIGVSIEAEVDGSNSRHQGAVRDLGIHGARVELRNVSRAELSGLRQVDLLMKRRANAHPVAVKANVVWQSPLGADGRVGLGLEFVSMPSELRRQISELAFWELVPDTDPQLVVFMGDLTESTEFGDLAERLTGSVEFDLAGIRYINSTGVRSWVYFLESLEHLADYGFARCSPPFARQASMIPRMLGRGRVISQYVPYICEQCGREEIELLELAPDVTLQDLAQRRFDCPACQSVLSLDDIPEKLFGYLVD